jgi:hypothetical protein
MVRSQVEFAFGRPSIRAGNKMQHERAGTCFKSCHKSNSKDKTTIMKAKCSTKCILGLIDCLEIQKDQTGLDDDWKVSFILTMCCGWTQVKWRTKLFHNSDSSWLERVLDTQA